MPIKHTQEDGTEVELYTSEELAAEKSAREALEGRVGELTNDIVQLKNGHKNEIKKLSEMSEEEKAKLTEEQRQTMARLEAVEEGRKSDLEAAKEAMFDRAAGNDPKVKEKLKEKYAIVQMPEGNAAEIAARLNSITSWAYAELGMTVNSPSISPVLPGGGNPPNLGGGEKNFTETDKGKALDNQLFGDILAEGSK